MKLTSKIAILLTLVTGSVVASYAFMELRSREGEVRADVDLRHRLLLSHATPALSNALWNVDPLAARTAALSLFETASVLKLTLYTAEGAPFLVIEREGAGLRVDDSAELRKLHGLMRKELAVEGEGPLMPRGDKLIERVSKARSLGADTFRVLGDVWFEREGDTEHLGYVVLDFHTREVEGRLATLRLRIAAFSGFLILGIVLLGVVFLRRSVILRVRRLESASVKTTHGQAEVVPMGTGSDELDSLTLHFNKMVESLLATIDIVSERAHLEGELQAAKAVQTTLLPRQTSFPGVDIATHYHPATNVGGDWFGFSYDERLRRLYFFVGDVTGHGIPSALVTALVAGGVSALLHRKRSLAEGTAEAALREICHGLNHVVSETGGQAGRYMTMLLGCLETDSGTLTLLNAGHPPPYILSLGRAHPVPIDGNALGFASEHENEAVVRALKPGDMLFAYTDGLLENRSRTGAELPRRTLKSILEEQGTTGELCKRLAIASRDFWEGEPPADDVSFLFLRWPGVVR